MTVTYNNSSSGNWSNALNWLPTVVPNNGNGLYYNAVIGGGTLTQDISPSATIQQLQMSGGTLYLTNPLTLNAGLLFTGGNLYNGTLNIAGSSTQSATMGVSGTTLNNSGSYDVSFESGDVFSGGAVFNNSGLVRKSSGTGVTNFNNQLNNTGTVSAETGTLQLAGGGTSSGLFSANSGAALNLASNYTFTTGASFSGAGTVKIGNGTAASFSGMINNNGHLLVGAAGSYTDFYLDADVTLNGNGTLTLADAARVRGSGILTNSSNTIEGETSNSGSLGYNQIGIINQVNGVIDANNLSGLALVVDPSSGPGLVNDGTMQASNGGHLVLSGYGGGNFDNTNGTILALNGSEVQLASSAVIIGGLLNTTGSGVIRTLDNDTISNLTNAGMLVVSDATTLNLIGTIVNTGEINVKSTGSYTDLGLSSNVTLTGGGTLNLQNAARVRGSGVLTNVNNTIEGETSNSGGFGYNQIGIVNQGNGLIDANVNAAALVVDPNSGDGLTNLGTMQASNGGILNLSGYGGGGFDNTGGTIEAMNGSQVQLTSGAVVTGGTLATSGSGLILTPSGMTATIVGLTTSGALRITNSSSLNLQGAINNSGTITVAATGSYTDLYTIGNVTLSGGGIVTLQDAARFRGDGNVLTNANNTIQGETSNSGGFGYNQIGIVNQASGVINANVSDKALDVDPNSGSGLTNAGLMEASNGGILVLSGYGGGSFANNGTIKAFDASQVQLDSGAIITGGTLTTSGTGLILTASGSSDTIIDLTMSGALQVTNATALTLQGTINNNGSITVASTGSYTDLYTAGDVTLTGSGTITLQNAARFRGDGGTLTNTNNTIQGETFNNGGFGYNQIAIVNQASGVIDANVSGKPLVLDPNSANGLTNAGLMKATGGGILLLSGYGGGGFDSTGGNVIAYDLSEVQLSSGASVSGGLWQTQGTGVIRVVDTASLTNLSLGANFIANDSSSTTFGGTINNNGNITFNSTGGYTDLLLNGNVSLTGTGNFYLKNADRVRGSGTLTNVGNTIQGETSNSGGLGYNQIGIVNQSNGVIDANVSGKALVVDPDSTTGLTNNGAIQASNGGVLDLSGYGGGDFINNGTIQALTGGTIQASGNITSSGTIDVGTSMLAMSSGNLTLLGSSKLSFQLGGLTQGSTYGYINVNGTVGLNGQLVVRFANGFAPSSTSTFTLMTSSNNFSGSFTNVASGSRLSVTGSSGSFLVNYNANTLTLTNYSATMMGRIRQAFTAKVPSSASVSIDSTARQEPEDRDSPIIAGRGTVAPAQPRVAQRSPLSIAAVKQERIPAKQTSHQRAVIHVSDSSQLQAMVDKTAPSEDAGRIGPTRANTSRTPGRNVPPKSNVDSSRSIRQLEKPSANIALPQR